LKKSIPFLTGLLLGALALAAAITLLLLFLPQFLVVTHEPVKADAVIVLGGDPDGSRLRRGVELVDQGWAPRLILVSGSKKGWLHVERRFCPDCRLEKREVVYLEGSVDTRTDARLSLEHCRKEGLQKVLVVTSPYHSRRSQFVFNDLYNGRGVEPAVVNSGGYGRLVPPDGPWWRDRPTLESVWLEFGKILFWELTPFMEWPEGREF
jgi:uncharacterized SAM-binding protein YcdF (DUF218 family)